MGLQPRPEVNAFAWWLCSFLGLVVTFFLCFGGLFFAGLLGVPPLIYLFKGAFFVATPVALCLTAARRLRFWVQICIGIVSAMAMILLILIDRVPSFFSSGSSALSTMSLLFAQWGTAGAAAAVVPSLFQQWWQEKQPPLKAK